ncbi:hypothetical protein Pla123a_05510 [Posidoniimonas polymericola]|uniref:Uncharacterized protein n=1 Tax=Posidoniimonas polymericola TaxID=2528002 RepID=A0A5C5ZEF8_9BACT|nr:hypothetical protein [Posidoniimonas polymericola]TWT85744.1 hypothetical protein Pla123a_05510 [Posidoniimonas polymericola]
MHLLPCACGKSIPVEVSQAGDRVTCECGAQVEVPPLRQLRELPVQEDAAAPVTRPKSDWAVHQGVLTAGMLIALTLAGIGLWRWAHEPPMPKGFDAEATGQRVDNFVDQMTPGQAYGQWVTSYSQSRGLEVMQSDQEEALIAYIGHLRQLRWALLTGAAVVAVLSVLLYLQLKPRKQRS